MNLPGKTNFAAWLLVAMLLIRPSGRAEVAANEAEIKAAFIPHLIGFVNWPAETFSAETEPIHIGLLGDFPLSAEAEKVLAAQKIQGRQLVIRHLTAASEAATMQVLLVGKSEAANLKNIFTATSGRSVLTIGDTEGFAAQGGVINFIRLENKVRFEINTGVANQARLKISSRLLQAAHVIQP